MAVNTDRNARLGTAYRQTETFDPSLAIDPPRATEARRLLMAAVRRLRSLEHPTGYQATHNGRQLLTEAVNRVRDALVQLQVEQRRDR